MESVAQENNMCFKRKNKIKNAKPKMGLTKEEILREIEHYKKWLQKTTILKERKQIQFMIKQYQSWFNDFDILDVNHDGILQKNEVN
ncbi:MAG: hypothetical protein LBS76_02230 [Mycoplasmataceae bacterium]|jgi:hypothetical protein|nr:hypothetical protein [Mycoplasmataceae bacterium]